MIWSLISVNTYLEFYFLKNLFMLTIRNSTARKLLDFNVKNIKLKYLRYRTHPAALYPQTRLQPAKILSISFGSQTIVKP